MDHRAWILGVAVDSLEMHQVVKRVEELIDEGSPHMILTANAEFVMRARRDSALAKIAAGAHIVVADGAGLVWASGFLRTRLPGRVAGIDLMGELLSMAAKRGHTVYMLGASPGVAEEAARRAVSRYPGLRVAGTYHGYFGRASKAEESVLRDIRSASPDILFVGLGAPLQEVWISSHIHELGVPVAMGVGGALDVLAGRVGRAPRWMQGKGLEWLYRLISDPRRARRMAVLPVFVARVIFEARRRQT